MLELAVDNDVIFKFCEYRMLEKLGHFGCEAECENKAGALGAAVYVGVQRLQAKVDSGDLDPIAIDELRAFLDATETLEPSDAEARAAAELEEWALLNRLSLDAGESQLLAMASSRVAHFLSGDKRAIASAETALPAHGWLAVLVERVWCLEQAIGSVVSADGALTVRSRICASPATDVALRTSFECASPERPDFEPVGLASYVDDLRRAAPTLLGRGYRVLLAA